MRCAPVARPWPSPFPMKTRVCCPGPHLQLHLRWVFFQRRSPPGGEPEALGIGVGHKPAGRALAFVARDRLAWCSGSLARGPRCCVRAARPGQPEPGRRPVTPRRPSWRRKQPCADRPPPERPEPRSKPGLTGLARALGACLLSGASEAGTESVEVTRSRPTGTAVLAESWSLPGLLPRASPEGQPWGWGAQTRGRPCPSLGVAWT